MKSENFLHNTFGYLENDAGKISLVTDLLAKENEIRLPGLEI
jgi:hypothetical protein